MGVGAYIAFINDDTKKEKNTMIKTLLVFTCLTLSISVNAATINLSSEMNGAQANAGAGSGSGGVGFANMTLDTATNFFSWNISWSGLTGTATSAHFHGPALPSQTAGVQVAIGIASNPVIGSATITNEQQADLLAGLWYVNVHSTADPGGEIRGQVSVVPIPAAAWLFGSALLGLLGVARRKKL